MGQMRPTVSHECCSGLTTAIVLVAVFLSTYCVSVGEEPATLARRVQNIYIARGTLRDQGPELARQTEVSVLLEYEEVDFANPDYWSPPVRYASGTVRGLLDMFVRDRPYAWSWNAEARAIVIEYRDSQRRLIGSYLTRPFPRALAPQQKEPEYAYRICGDDVLSAWLATRTPKETSVEYFVSGFGSAWGASGMPLILSPTCVVPRSTYDAVCAWLSAREGRYVVLERRFVERNGQPTYDLVLDYGDPLPLLGAASTKTLVCALLRKPFDNLGIPHRLWRQDRVARELRRRGEMRRAEVIGGFVNDTGGGIFFAEAIREEREFVERVEGQPRGTPSCDATNGGIGKAAEEICSAYAYLLLNVDTEWYLDLLLDIYRASDVPTRELLLDHVVCTGMMRGICRDSTEDRLRPSVAVFVDELLRSRDEKERRVGEQLRKVLPPVAPKSNLPTLETKTP